MTEGVIESAGGDCRMRAALDGDPNLSARRAERVGDGVLSVDGLFCGGAMSVVDGVSREERKVR